MTNCRISPARGPRRGAGRVAALAVLAAGGAGLFLLQSLAQGTPDPVAAEPGGRPLPVATGEVRYEEGFEISRRYTGELRAGRSVDLGFETGGRVALVHVVEGQQVAAGDPIADLDDQTLRAQRTELEARQATARARLAEAEAGPRAETKAAAAAAVTALEGDLELAHRRLSRRSRLLESAAVSSEEVDQAELSAAVLEARLSGARAQLAELEAGTRVEVLAAAQAQVAELEAGLATLDLLLEDHRVLAPFDGRIAARHVHEGAVVSAGAPAVHLVETGALEAWIGLDPTGLETLDASSGGPLPTVEVLGRDVAVLNTRTFPLLEPGTRTVRVAFELDPNSAAGLLPGQVATLRLGRRLSARGAWLPLAALSEGTRGLWTVYALPSDSEGGPVERHDVELVHVSGEQAYVRGTLVEGSRVVLSGAHRLVPGQEVEAAPTEQD